MKSFLANVQYVAVPVLSDLIPSLPKPQDQILWVGCSDSQIVETDIIHIPREQLFVHRNLGNKLSNGDTSSLSAVEHCVQDIQVNHIIICGHYGCGVINTHGKFNSADDWLGDLDVLREVGEPVDEEDMGIEERDRRLVELNVLAQIHWVMQQPSVMKAVRERDMKVYGLVYSSAERSCVRLEMTS